MALQRSSIYLRQITPKLALLLCFLTGASTALSFAPFHIWPVLFVAFPVFFLLLESAPSRRSAMGRSYFFGYGYFMAGTWWIANALLVDAAQFGWLVPFCVIGLTGLFALWFVLFGWMFWMGRAGRTASDIMLFAVLWVALECLHSVGWFGFPWNLLGYVALSSIRISQIAALIGPYGLSLFVVTLALLPLLFIKPDVSSKQRTILLAVALALLIGAYGYGMKRMPAQAAMTNTRLRIVQANIPQGIKWTEEGRANSLKIHAGMSRLQSDAPLPSIIIWPESAFPYTIYPGSDWPKRLSELAPAGGLLITGTVHGDDSGAELKLWNSILAVDSRGTIVGSYDKHQLVPFGEFVPLRNLLPMNKITPGGIDFSRGRGASTITISGHPSFSPLICYEAIFPWIAVDSAKRPAWILNVTNDAWYGDTPGPYQHLAMSRMRAIEQGLPVVRAANTGISAVIDPFGRIVRMMPLNQRGIIDQALPAAQAPTFYTEHGERMVFLLILLLCIVRRSRV